MAQSLLNTMNFSQPFIEYSPLTAGFGQEPAVSIATMIRNSLLNPGVGSWFWNRGSTMLSLTTAGGQDYTATLADFGYIEKCTIKDDQNNIWELKDVHNTTPLSLTSEAQRPNAISLESNDGITQVFRFQGVPDKSYTANVIYQKKSQPFGPYFISSSADVSGGNTVYTGSFDPASFPVGATAVITGFTNPVNNGSFVVAATTTTTVLTLANAGGVAETISAYASNFSWGPVPDSYSDVYNNLFLAEAMALVDDARSQVYRQRGVAAFLAKAQGLSDTQKNVFVQQWLSRSAESATASLRIQQAVAARGN